MQPCLNIQAVLDEQFEIGSAQDSKVGLASGGLERWFARAIKAAGTPTRRAHLRAIPSRPQPLCSSVTRPAGGAGGDVEHSHAVNMWPGVPGVQFSPTVQVPPRSMLV